MDGSEGIYLPQEQDIVQPPPGCSWPPLSLRSVYSVLPRTDWLVLLFLPHTDWLVLFQTSLFHCGMANSLFQLVRFYLVEWRYQSVAWRLTVMPSHSVSFL